MSEIQAAGTIILFFALRCIVPLLVTVAIAYFMNRLVDRWEAEEAASQETDETLQPAIPTARPANSTARNIPCWVVRNCDKQQRDACPAYLNQSVPCWIARLLSDGAVPESCPDCPIFDPQLAIR